MKGFLKILDENTFGWPIPRAGSDVRRVVVAVEAL